MQISAPSSNPRVLKRAAVASAWSRDPSASPNSIAKAACSSVKLAKRWKPGLDGAINLSDAPRSGRKRKLDDTDLQAAESLASQPAVHGSKRVARAMQAERGLSVGASTVRRNFGQKGMIYSYTKIETVMTEKHKADRVAWARDKLDKKFDWSGVLMTDSKLFPLHITVAKRGRKSWQNARQRIVEERPRASAAVHMYAGVSAYANTPLLSVTCAGGQKNTKFVNAKTRAFHKGVGAEEYYTKVLPWFKVEGDRIFNKYGEWGGEWKFMQDGAPPHTATVTQAKLQSIWGQGRLLDWPANSPDLNVVENSWALLDRQLDAKLVQFDTLQQLEAELNSICRKFSRSTCRRMLKGMPDRLRKVIALGGARIDK